MGLRSGRGCVWQTRISFRSPPLLAHTILVLRDQVNGGQDWAFHPHSLCLASFPCALLPSIDSRRDQSLPYFPSSLPSLALLCSVPLSLLSCVDARRDSGFPLAWTPLLLLPVRGADQWNVCLCLS